MYNDSGPPGRMAADCRRYTRYVQRYTQCSGDDSSPSSPAEGLAPLDVTNTNVPRFRPSGPVGGRFAAATVGVPFLGRYHSPPQVIHLTWRAADCRPYGIVHCDTV